MSETTDIKNALIEFKRKLAGQLLIGFTILCGVGLPFSLYRWVEIGFQLVFIHHIFISVIVFICFYFRNQTSYKLHLTVIALSLISMIVSGTLSFGLQTGVITFAPVVSFLVVMIAGVTAAIIFTIVWAVFFVAVGYAFTTQSIEYAVAPEIYAQSVSAWYIMAIGSLISICFLLISAKQGYQKLIKLMGKIQHQQSKIAYLADHDQMTGFKAARLATPLLEQSINLANRNNTMVAVVFVDLNNFKIINDTFGHTVGDEVLILAASSLSNGLRDMDVSIRVGGDEFLFILPEVKCKSDIDHILKRMTAGINKCFQVSGHEILVEASLGVSIFPDDSDNPSRLRMCADMAMYNAKVNKSDVPLFFNELNGNQV